MDLLHVAGNVLLPIVRIFAVRTAKPVCSNNALNRLFQLNRIFLPSFTCGQGFDGVVPKPFI
jgi:hypothetical protein